MTYKKIWEIIVDSKSEIAVGKFLEMKEKKSCVSSA